MIVSDIMSRQVLVASPADTVERAAVLMTNAKIGILPIVSGTRIVGLITDRDIVARAVASGKTVKTCPVDDVMTEEVHYCVADDTVEDVAQRMAELGVRRMPVLDRTERLIGIVSLDDIAAHPEFEHIVARALRRIAEVSGVAR